MSYFSKLLSTGAVRKTPPHIIEKIAREINHGANPIIIEIGAGRGEITKELVQKNKGGNYYAFEIDPHFAATLTTRFPGIHVLQTDALKFREATAVPPAADYFISSIPLSFYHSAEIRNLLHNALLSLNQGGKIIVLFTAFWLIPLLKKALPGIRVEPFATVPPYFLAVYQKN